MKKSLRILILSLFITLQSVSSFGSFGIKAKKSDATEQKLIATEPKAEEIKSAMQEFKNLSRREKKDRFKDLKKYIKDFKDAKKQGADVSTNTLLLVLLSILIPPLAVYLHEGSTNNKFWLNVVLTLLGYVVFGFAGAIFLGSLPGIIHALIVVLS